MKIITKTSGSMSPVSTTYLTTPQKISTIYTEDKPFRGNKTDNKKYQRKDA